MRKEIINGEEVYYGTGNVFADLELPNPEECLLKVQLMHTINKDIAKRKLKQDEIATMVGLKQPEISLIARGRGAGFSVERLISVLRCLGHDVEVTVSPTVHQMGKLRFLEAA
jgi:predicted XRE-type DNA-binding protein